MKMRLPKELGDVKALMKRFKDAKKRKSGWIEHMRECYEYAIPNRETFSDHVEGQKKNTTIYDSTAQIATQRFASRIQATITPPWRKFSIMTPGTDVPEADREDVQEKLDDISDTVFDYFNHSNFSTEINQSYLDLAVGTCGIWFNEGDDNPFEFTAMPQSDTYIEEGADGMVRTVWRERNPQARNIKHIWKNAEIPPELEKIAATRPNDPVRIVEGVVYVPENQEYHHVVIYAKKDTLLYTENFGESSPAIVARWSTVSGEVYGRGPLMTVLPDIKTANKVVEFVLKNAALHVSGVYTARNDGVLNPHTARLHPGTFLPVKSNDRTNPTVRALERSGDFNVAELVLEDLRERIKTGLYNSMRTAEGPVKTATEIALDNMELVQDTGSSFGRIQSELVEPLFRRAIYILRKRGKIPVMRVDGKEVTIKHTSPLARAQDQEDLLAYSGFMEQLGLLGPEMVHFGAKTEALPGWLGKKYGIPQDLIRDESEQGGLMEVIRNYLAEQGGEAVADS